MILWDGKSESVFLDILECVEKEQPVRVETADGAVRAISTLEDVRRLLPPRNPQTELSRREYEEILETFLPSEEMRAHLLEKAPGRRQIIDLMLGAPVSLETKAEYFQRLSARDDVFHCVLDGMEDTSRRPDAKWMLEIELDRSFAKHAREIRAALDALCLEPGELLLLNEAWYDDDYLEDNGSKGSVPFLSVDAALRYLRDEIRDEEWEDEAACWTVLEKWAPGENGETEARYRYYLIRDAFVFFEKLERDRQDRWFWFPERGGCCCKGIDLNLPVPYHPGDIVEVDCLPFAPVRHVLLLEVGDDCCGVSCLYRTNDGRWDTGALKHGHFMESYTPMLSPLYRIASYDGPLPTEEQLLRKVRAYLNGSAEKVRQLWDSFHQLSCPLRTGEVMKLIGYGEGYDEAGTLLTYHMGRQITADDIGSVWPYRTDVSVGFRHEYDDEILFLLRSRNGLHEALVIWDKETNKAVSSAATLHCMDAIRFHGKYYRLVKSVGKPEAPLLIVRQSRRDQQCSRCIFREQLDPLILRGGAHLEAAGNSLFLVVNGKRYADLTPESLIEAGG